jgi:Xaa-Pro aminopeptidase
LYLTHDAAALVELRKAAAVSVEAHKAGIIVISKAKLET